MTQDEFIQQFVAKNEQETIQDLIAEMTVRFHAAMARALSGYAPGNPTPYGVKVVLSFKADNEEGTIFSPESEVVFGWVAHHPCNPIRLFRGDVVVGDKRLEGFIPSLVQGFLQTMKDLLDQTFVDFTQENMKKMYGIKEG